MKNKKLTLTIAIPAYNEEKNIEILLTSLLNQKRNNFILKKIVVYSDGGTDTTNSKVQALGKKHLSIKLVFDKERRGKYFRVNQAFKKCKTDALVILDADITLVGNNFLDNLVNVLRSDTKAQLIAAHQILLRPKEFIGKIIHTSFVMWDFVRLSIPDHNSAINFFGAATAYRGSFARSVEIPNTLHDPHLFIYLKAARINGFRYCRKAEILHWSISTISDLNKFLHRSIGKKDKELEKIFGVNLEEAYFIPRRYKLIGVIKCFIWQPFYTPLALVLSLLMTRKTKKIISDKSPVWGTMESTKKSMIFLNKERK